MSDLIFVYGPPGSGKTTVGRIIAQSLNLPFTDLDDAIVEIKHQPIPKIFEREGEAGFRSIEKQALQKIINRNLGVCALGGGALLDPDCLEMASMAGRILCLNASYDSLCLRLDQVKDGERPLLAGGCDDQLRRLLISRAGHYASFADQINTDGKSPEQIAWEALAHLGRFNLSLGGQASDIRILKNIDEIGMAIANSHAQNTRAAIVTDDHVGPLYAGQVSESLQAAGYKTGIMTLPSGEDHKTLTTISTLWDEFIQEKLERQSLVIALGGGVVSDLTGFAAATFLRGIPWVVIPTTLLAAVDASIGGKTGIDLRQGKNLVGSFHFPQKVLVVPETLNSLPAAEFRNGLAEVIKHGVVGDPTLFELCQNGEDSIRVNLDTVISRAIAVKARIVQLDPFEANRRAELNFGHTVGHGLEVVSNYRLRHGEAVAIGMVVETALSEAIGLAKPGLQNLVTKVLEAAGLPTAIPDGFDRNALLDAMQMDKKRTNGLLHFSLPVKIGEVQSGVVVNDLASKMTLA